MANYLDTGAAGFIGSEIAAELLRQGHYVLTVDNLSTGKRSAVPVGCDFIEADCGIASTIGIIESKGVSAR